MFRSKIPLKYVVFECESHPFRHMYFISKHIWVQQINPFHLSQ